MHLDPRIRHDAERLAGDPQAAALLECLAKHVFDADLDIGSMVKICGASRRVRDRLVAKIGPLKTWLTEQRMVEAQRLVRDTQVPIKEIGQRVGYPVRKTFGRTFRKAHGQSPSQMRLEAQVTEATTTAKTTEPATSVGIPDDVREIEGDERLTPRALAARLRRRMAIGLLDCRRAAELRLKLRRRYPQLDDADARRRRDAPDQDEANPAGSAQEQYPIVLTPTGDSLEASAAAAVLGEIIDGPEAELRFTLLHGVVFGNVGAYRHLQRVCTALVTWNADRALVLAEIAVRMIEPHRQLMDDEADAWQAAAWVFLGRIQAHTGDDGGAEQSLAFACAEVGGTEGLPPWVEIELRQVEAMVRKRQRRNDEAMRSLDRAVELGRQLSRSNPDRCQVILQRLELASALGDEATGLALAQELEELITTWPTATSSDPTQSGATRSGATRSGATRSGATRSGSAREERLTLWHGFVSYHRAKAHAVAGRDGCAGCYLRQTINDIAADPACDSDPRLGLLFTFALHDLARVADRDDRPSDCESTLRLVVERYRWLEIPVFEAAAEAELAMVCALRGGWAEAQQLALASAAFLDDLPFHREAWNAARRLRTLASRGEAAAASELADLLATLRRDLDRVSWEIAGSQALPAARARRAEAA